MVVDGFVENVDKIVGRTTSRKDNKLPGGQRLDLGCLAILKRKETHSQEKVHHTGTLKP